MSVNLEYITKDPFMLEQDFLKDIYRNITQNENMCTSESSILFMKQEEKQGR